MNSSGSAEHKKYFSLVPLENKLEDEIRNVNIQFTLSIASGDINKAFIMIIKEHELQ